MIARDLIIWGLLISLLIILISQLLIGWKINKDNTKKETRLVNREILEKKRVGFSFKQLIKSIMPDNKAKLKSLIQLALDEAKEKEAILKKAIDENNTELITKSRRDFIESKRKVKRLLNELERLS